MLLLVLLIGVAFALWLFDGYYFYGVLFTLQLVVVCIA